MAGKPKMRGRKRSCTSHTSSAVSEGLSLPTRGASPPEAMALTAGAVVAHTGGGLDY